MIRNYNEIDALINKCIELANKAHADAIPYINFKSTTDNLAENITKYCTVAVRGMNEIRNCVATLNDYGYAKNLDKTQERLNKVVKALEFMTSDRFEDREATETRKQLGILHNQIEACIDSFERTFRDFEQL